MNGQAVAFLVFCLVAVAWSACLLAYPAWLRMRRRRLVRRPFPARWRTIVRRRVPLVARLPADLRRQLQQLMQVFLAEKVFIGCAGLQVTEEMRVVVAAQACLLLLHRTDAVGYFPKVRQVLLYPGPFLVQRRHTDAAGVQREERQALAGESWGQGQVILSWQDVLEGAAVPDDGRNVVLHEFAHQLDQENGPAHGAPPPVWGHVDYSAARWQQVFSDAYEALRAQAFMGEQGLLSHYGAQDPAEFFAVVVEVFFEQGEALAQAYPALYAELRGFFQLDTAHW